MSTETANLGLTKPELDEQFKLSDWNGNSDKIDQFAGEVNAALAGKASAADLAAKQDALTFDTGTAKDSENSIASGGIWASVWAQILGLNTGTNLAAGDDLDDFQTPGVYRCTNSTTAAAIANMPSAQAQQAGGRLIVSNLGGAGRVFQIYLTSALRFYMRSIHTSALTWSQWYEYAGTAVTPAASTNAAASEVI